MGAGAAALVAFKLLAAMAGVAAAWTPYLSIAAAVAIVLGGLAALSAGRLRELIGWLAVAQLGLVAAALSTGSRAGVAAGLFLLGAYMVAAAAAPAVLGTFEGGGAAGLAGLTGLAARQPWRALGFGLALVSLAGVPPLAGFFGEFAVATQLAASSLYWLLGIALFGSLLAVAASCRVLRVMYLLPPPDEARRLPSTPVSVLGWSAVGAFCLAYALLANPISTLALQGAKALGSR